MSFRWVSNCACQTGLTHGVSVQFSLNPELVAVSKGASVWIRVTQIEKLFAFHKEKNAGIISPLEQKPWGMADYTIRDINGHLIHFSAPLAEKRNRSEEFPKSINIVARKPTPTEYMTLVEAVGWGKIGNESIAESILAPAVFSVVALNTETQHAIGCAMLLGDNVTFYYVKDVMVHPQWQRRNVGTTLMKALNSWLESNTPPNAFVALISADHLSRFYKQFGFRDAFAMIKRT